DMFLQGITTLTDAGFDMNRHEQDTDGDNPGSASEPLRSAPYTKRVVVLIDSYCGSSCEMSILGLLKFRAVTFIGVNSADNIHFMSPGYMMLPNSRVIGMISPKRFTFEPDVTEGVGVVPDYYVIAPNDPVAAAVKYLDHSAQ